MSRGVSKTILLGNVGREPECRYTADGKAVTSFSLATSWGSKDRAKTEWHKIVCWERLAEIANQYITKGSKVYVEGRIQSRKYTDNGGVERTAYEIIAQTIELVSDGKQADGPPAAEGDDWGDGDNF